MQKKYFFIVLSALFITACTQQPAPVALRGQESFAKNTPNSDGGDKKSSSYVAVPRSGQQPPYSYNNRYRAPVSEATEQSAAVNSVESSDLPPPVKQDGADNKKIAPQEKVALKPEKPEAKQEVKPEAKSAVNNTSKEQHVEVETVNPWTNKPRDFSEDEAKISPVKQDAEKPPLPPSQTAQNADNNFAKPNKNETQAVTKSGDFSWPLDQGNIISSFGDKGGGVVNDGVNIAAQSGDAVHAASAGEVVYVGNNLDGYGNMVIIKHAGDKFTSYAHLGRAMVDKGQSVAQGDTIGQVGATGKVKTPQLFFSLRDGSKPIDPVKYIKSEVAGL